MDTMKPRKRFMVGTFPTRLADFQHWRILRMWKSVVMECVLSVLFGAVCAATAVQPASAQSTAWHHPDGSRPFSQDSLECAGTARQTAGDASGNTYSDEFVRCVKGRRWRKAWRYAGRDSCAPVSVSWLNPPNGLPAATLDSMRREIEAGVRAVFFPNIRLRDLEARVGFGPEGGEFGSTRIISAAAGRPLSDFDSTDAVEAPVMTALTNFPSIDAPTQLSEIASSLSGVVALRARCLRDLAVSDDYFFESRKR